LRQFPVKRRAFVGRHGFRRAGPSLLPRRRPALRILCSRWWSIPPATDVSAGRLLSWGSALVSVWLAARLPVGGRRSVGPMGRFLEAFNSGRLTPVRQMPPRPPCHGSPAERQGLPEAASDHPAAALGKGQSGRTSTRRDRLLASGRLHHVLHSASQAWNASRENCAASPPGPLSAKRYQGLPSARWL
jgi:hypothetical protein